MLGELHDKQPGINRLRALARSYVWWPLIETHIEQSVRFCKSCQPYQTMPEKAPVHPWETSEAPWIRVYLDSAGHFLDKMFLILYDSYSRWIEVYPMPSHLSHPITSKATINSLRHSFATHGLPHIIVTDNGTSFTSNEFKTFCKMNGIKHITTTPFIHRRMVQPR